MDEPEELFDQAPCGYVVTRPDGTFTRVNRTFVNLAGRPREALLSNMRIQDLLAQAGRVFYETHYTPLLRLQGSVKEIALDVVRPTGERVPVLELVRGEYIPRWR